MKKLLNYFKGKGTERGYMFLKGNTMEYSYQKHGCASYFIITLVFFLMVGNFSPKEAIWWKDILFVLAGTGMSTLVGFIIEQIQKKKPNRTYDVKDITIMTKASFVLGIIFLIIRQITF